MKRSYNTLSHFYLLSIIKIINIHPPVIFLSFNHTNNILLIKSQRIHIIMKRSYNTLFHFYLLSIIKIINIHPPVIFLSFNHTNNILLIKSQRIHIIMLINVLITLSNFSFFQLSIYLFPLSLLLKTNLLQRIYPILIYPYSMRELECTYLEDSEQRDGKGVEVGGRRA